MEEVRRAARVDANQPAIVKAMRKIGAVVTPMHTLGQGVPDLLVSYRQRWHVIEVKTERGELTPDQLSWIGAQRAGVVVVTSPLEAVAFLQRIP